MAQSGQGRLGRLQRGGTEAVSEADLPSLVAREHRKSHIGLETLSGFDSSTPNPESFLA